MTEEEKEVIKTFKKGYGLTKAETEIILNLIDKQQKEIQKLQEKNKKYQRIENGTTIIYKSKAKYVREDRIEKYYIDKNKIREKIRDYKEYEHLVMVEKYNYREIIQGLEELLKE